MTSKTTALLQARAAGDRLDPLPQDTLSQGEAGNLMIGGAGALLLRRPKEGNPVTETISPDVAAEVGVGGQGHKLLSRSHPPPDDILHSIRMT